MLFACYGALNDVAGVHRALSALPDDGADLGAWRKYLFRRPEHRQLFDQAIEQARGLIR